MRCGQQPPSDSPSSVTSPRARGDQPRDRLEQGALSRAVRAADPEHSPGGLVEADAVEHGDPPVADARIAVRPRPSSSTTPASGGRSMPEITFTSVLFPVPLEPISATIVPGRTSRETFRTAGSAPPNCVSAGKVLLSKMTDRQVAALIGPAPLPTRTSRSSAPSPSPPPTSTASASAATPPTSTSTSSAPRASPSLPTSPRRHHRQRPLRPRPRRADPRHRRRRHRGRRPHRRETRPAHGSPRPRAHPSRPTGGQHGQSR